MGLLTIGDVVLIPLPYSDLSRFKARPALVVNQAEFGNLIVCQITSKPYSSRIAIVLPKRDFVEGGLIFRSYVRPDKLFTVDPAAVKGRLGRISPTKLNEIRNFISRLFGPV